MKLDIQNQHDAEQIARYLGGEMSAGERLDFEAVIAGDPENINLISGMKKQWNRIGEYKPAGQPDARNAWNKLHGRLDREHLIPEPKPAKPAVRPGAWLRVAAALLILAGLGTAVYFWTSRPAQMEEMVQVGNTSQRNTLVKTLADGSIVYLAPNAAFRFPQRFESGSRSVELSGEAFFDIAPDRARPFVISTNNTIVTVLGTAFNVKTSNHSNFELAVSRGKVRVEMRASGSKPVEVEAGEKVEMVSSQLQKSKTGPGKRTPWYRQQIQFKDESLQNIILVLNRNFNTNFVLAGNKLGERRLTVTFDNESPATMAELICAALNLESEQSNGAVVLSEKN